MVAARLEAGADLASASRAATIRGRDRSCILPIERTSRDFVFYWKKEIAKRDRESASAATTASPALVFVPVAVINSPAHRDETPIDIRLAEGHRVRVRAGCDCALLADVLAMLHRPVSEGRPC